MHGTPPPRGSSSKCQQDLPSGPPSPRTVSIFAMQGFPPKLLVERDPLVYSSLIHPSVEKENAIAPPLQAHPGS